MPVVGEVISSLGRDLDALIDCDPVVLGDGETLVDLQRQRERLDAAITRATAAFDGSGAWRDDGARSAASWLAFSTKLPLATARRRVRMGRELRHLERLEQAWLAGEVGEAQVGLVTRARTPATEEALARDEQLLVDHARRLGFGSFSRVMSYWVAYADPDGAEDEAKAAHDRRRVHLSQSFGGRWVLDGILDPIGGSILDAELRRIEKEFFDTDWAEAKARVGEGVRQCDLARTPAQRRADALVEMARRSATAPADGRMPEPLFTVLVGYDAFCRTCELANRTVVTPGSLVPYLDDAWVERVVFDGPSRVIDVGVRRRLFDGATRRAALVRDRECFHDTCDVPAERCEVDHIERWAAGGLTTTDNGRPACEFHNRGRHRRTLTPARSRGGGAAGRG